MRHAGDTISAYLDGELRPEEVRRLLEHLASCGRCSAEMTALQGVRSSVRSLPMIELPRGILPGADATPIPLRRNRGFIAAVAAAVVAAVIGIAALVTPPPESISVEDLNSRFGARLSLDPAFGPAKVLVPETVELQR